MYCILLLKIKILLLNSLLWNRKVLSYVTAKRHRMNHKFQKLFTTLNDIVLVPNQLAWLTSDFILETRVDWAPYLTGSDQWRTRRRQALASSPPSSTAPWKVKIIDSSSELLYIIVNSPYYFQTYKLPRTNFLVTVISL